MNQKFRHIAIRLGPAASDFSEAPGNPKMWQVLEKKLGLLKCRRSLGLLVQTPAGWPPAWTLDFLKEHLVFRGPQDLEFCEALSHVAVQVFRKGRDPDPLAQLVREWLGLNLKSAGSVEVFAFRQFEFASPMPKVAAQDLKSSLEQVLSLGSHCGLFHPSTEDVRVLLPGVPQDWAQGLELPVLQKQAEKVFFKSLKEGAWSPLRRHYRRTELRNRTPVSATEDLLRPVAALSAAGVKEPGTGGSSEESVYRAQTSFSSSAPLSMLVSQPRGAERKNFSKFRYRCETVAGLYDRSLGSIVFRKSSPGALMFDVWSPLPLNNSDLGPAPASGKAHLCCLGPWDARNPVAERRIEVWLEEVSKNFLIEGEVVDGDQDWLAYAVQVLSHAGGAWDTILSETLELMRDNLIRARCHRAWFFWTSSDPELLNEWAHSHGLPFSVLARRGSGAPGLTVQAERGKSSSCRNFSWAELNVENPKRDGVHELVWEHPDVKSPSYGFERVAVYPDDYMLKVAFREADEQLWNKELALCFSGDRMRSVILRNALCAPIMGFRWTDGPHLWAEAFGKQEGWIDVDPRAAGQAAVDQALRMLVALGGHPGRGQAQIWISQPESGAVTSEGKESKEWAAYLLALEGASQMARAYGYSLRSINGGGMAFPGVQDDLFVGLRDKLPPKAPTALPGFRMSGEALYCVGPRPVFMDAGSRILDHVPRVMSNHISRLHPSQQLELYQIVADLLARGVATCVRAVGEGGVVATLAEMACWSGMGAQLRPNLTTTELFSGSPGRLIVGVLPQEAKNFESLIKGEQLIALGTSGGERVCGLPLSKLKELRQAAMTPEKGDRA